MVEVTKMFNQDLAVIYYWWDISHLVEVNDNINLGYSQARVTPSFRVRACFRAILL